MEQYLFCDWSEKFLLYKQNKVSAGHYKSLSTAAAHANDFFGNRKLCEITAHDIDNMMYSPDLLNYRTGKPLSRKSIKNVRDVIAAIFDFAAEDVPNICLKNPAKGRRVPTDALVSKREAIPLPLQQLLVANSYHGMHLASMIMLLCGLRRGELIPLLWTDIDFENRLLSVSKTVVEKGRSFIVKIGRAKTASSLRKIPIPAVLLALLKEKLSSAVSPYICPDEKGEIHTPATWHRDWKTYNLYLQNQYKVQIVGMPQIPAGANIIHITPHQLRHTYATILFNAGVDVLSAAKFLGHKNPETTIKIYTHLQREKEVNVVSLYNAYVSKILATFSGVSL